MDAGRNGLGVKLTISPTRTTQVLTLAVLCLTLASVAGQFSKYYLDDFLGRGTFIALFSIDREHNIPSWYASSTLLLCAVLLATIGLAKKQDGARYVLHWIALSIIFLYVSVDEGAEIHELLTSPLRSALNVSGFLHSAWVIPGAAFVLILALAYLRFLRDLPANTWRLFLLAGCLFVGGALGMELISGRYADSYGLENMTYAMLATVEEFFEMLGVVVFLYALMSYVSSQVGEVRVAFVHAQGQTRWPKREPALRETGGPARVRLPEPRLDEHRDARPGASPEFRP